MKFKILGILALLILTSCNKQMESTKVIFLHHSTGGRIWKGNPNKYFYKVFKQGYLEKWMKRYNRKNQTNIDISKMNFPKKEPYGWKNYPFDYYNIWVAHGGKEAFMSEPTLEMLTEEYDIIIWKHCYPVANIQPDTTGGDINSEIKTLPNYKLQYEALKKKMHSFKDKKFIVWTPVPQVKAKTSEEEAKRLREFYEWVLHTWDEKNDNIFLWDYYILATEGGLYLKPEYAEREDNSHPNKEFAEKISGYFANRIVQVAAAIAEDKDITGRN